MTLRVVWMAVVAFGFIQRIDAQAVIDNPYSGISTASAVFTPDVMRDLGSPTRIRVVLTFQNDTWRVKSAKIEEGVYSSYPASTGFVRADLVGKGGKVISSIGVPDPRVIRIYQAVPQGAQWSPAPHGLNVSHPVAQIPTTLAMQGHVTTLPLAQISKSSGAPTPSAATAVSQPLAANANPATSVTPIFHANAKLDKADFAVQVAARASHASLRPLGPPPPHLDAQLASGQVVLFLPNKPSACSVNISIAPAKSSAIRLATPLIDSKGSKQRCEG